VILDEWTQYRRSMFGLLSIGYEHHNVVLGRGKQKSLLHLGFQLKLGTDLKDFAKKAQDYGVGAERKSNSQSGISNLVEIEIPHGNVFQFSLICPLKRSGPAAAYSPSPAARSRRQYSMLLSGCAGR